MRFGRGPPGKRLLHRRAKPISRLVCSGQQRPHGHRRPLRRAAPRHSAAALSRHARRGRPRPPRRRQGAVGLPARHRAGAVRVGVGPAAVLLALVRLLRRLLDRLGERGHRLGLRGDDDLADDHARDHEASGPRLEARPPRGGLQAGEGHDRAHLHHRAADRRDRVRLLVLHHRRARTLARPHALVGLLDYYRQFDDVDQEEINRELRARRAREKAQALAEIPTIDLSSTEWPDFPSSEVMNAAIAAARGRVNSYPDRHAEAIRRELASRHDVAAEQIVVGNGAAELLQTAAMALLAPGDELVTPWPSYPLFPLMASRAGGRPIAVDLAAGRVEVEATLRATTERTRAVVLCNPNDPTGTYLEADAVAALAGSLPEHVHLLVDEAYVDFQDIEPRDSVLRLVDAFPRLIVFRTFSKIWGLSGLRAGYAVGSSAGSSLLASIAPALGVNVLTQAGIRKALEIGEREVERRRALVVQQRRRVLDALHDLPVDAPPSEANFVWLHAAGLSGAELAARLERAGVLVAAGGPLGADDHVRAAIRGAAASERLLSALAQALG